MTALTGMSTYAAAFLIPVSVCVYTTAGGLKGQDIHIVDSWFGKLHGIPEPQSSVLASKYRQGYFIFILLHAIVVHLPQAATVTWHAFLNTPGSWGRNNAFQCCMLTSHEDNCS